MKWKLLVGLVLLTILAGHLVFAAETAAPIKVLLITGGHGFEEESFFKVFKDNREITLTTATHGKTNATAFEREDLLRQDVVVLYDMQKEITDGQKAKVLALFDKGIGLVVLHHALVSYQHWPVYKEVIGGKYPEADGKSGVVTAEVGFQHDVESPIVIVAKDHPVTAGLKDFTIHDEIYWGFTVRPDATPLITTTQPKSGKPLAWCRSQGKSRVVTSNLGTITKVRESQLPKAGGQQHSLDGAKVNGAAPPTPASGTGSPLLQLAGDLPGQNLETVTLRWAELPGHAVQHRQDTQDGPRAGGERKAGEEQIPRGSDQGIFMRRWSLVASRMTSKPCCSKARR